MSWQMVDELSHSKRVELLKPNIARPWLPLEREQLIKRISLFPSLLSQHQTLLHNLTVVSWAHNEFVLIHCTKLLRVHICLLFCFFYLLELLLSFELVLFVLVRQLLEFWLVGYDEGMLLYMSSWVDLRWSVGIFCFVGFWICLGHLLQEVFWLFNY